MSRFCLVELIFLSLLATEETASGAAIAQTFSKQGSRQNDDWGELGASASYEDSTSYNDEVVGTTTSKAYVAITGDGRLELHSYSGTHGYEGSSALARWIDSIEWTNSGSTAPPWVELRFRYPGTGIGGPIDEGAMSANAPNVHGGFAESLFQTSAYSEDLYGNIAARASQTMFLRSAWDDANQKQEDWTDYSANWQGFSAFSFTVPIFQDAYGNYRSGEFGIQLTTGTKVDSTHLGYENYDASAISDFYNTMTLSQVVLPDGTPVNPSDLSFESGLSVPSPSSIPEPSSLAMFAGLGVMGLVAARRRRRRAA